ncbi:Protein of unknown function [Propionibacterium freudenreichii]|nr:Protein of unknown function [Propionibacterium freudenreichii]
MSLLNHLT